MPDSLMVKHMPLEHGNVGSSPALAIRQLYDC